MLIKSSNKLVAVVTGASKGIGASIAEALACTGVHVVMISRNKQLLRQRCQLLKEKGYSCSYFAENVLNFHAISEIIGELSRLDILINNASGIIIKNFEEYTENDFDDLISLNVKSYFKISQLAIRKFKQNKEEGGIIINISSIMGKVAQPQNSPRPQTLYIIAKHAIEGLTKALSVELASQNIRVNSICPTYVMTDFVKSTLENKEMRKFYLNRIPLHRFVEPKDVAEAVLFLCSSKMITGTSIVLDGGWCAV